MKLLIADDEAFTREGLRAEINWMILGIDEIMEAGDGEEALAISEWFQPDIVLTDVRMPCVDGISYARKVLEKIPDCKILFMSAFMEIEYLKKAIQLSAVDYIEKPININEVMEAVQKAIDSIKYKKTKEKCMENATLLHGQRLAYFLKSKKSDMQTVEKLCPEAGFPLQGNYNCCIVNVLNKDYAGIVFQEELQSFFDRKQIDCITTHPENEQLIAILGIKSFEHYYFTEDFFEPFLRKYPDCHIGIGFEVNSLRAISESFQVANKAVCKGFYYPEKKIYQLDNQDVKQQPPDPDLFPGMHHLLINEPEKLPAFFNHLCAELLSNMQLHPDNVRALFISFAKDIIRQNISGEEGLYKAKSPQEVIDDAKTLGQIKDYVMELTYQLLRESGKKTRYSPFVREVANYIGEHYPDKGLGLSDIAEYMKVSIPHLSDVFKKETDSTVRWYIENCRIEHAKRLLKDCRFRVVEVSEACGFSNSNYFSKVFRDVTGYTPTEYKDKISW